jgi:isoprenylcysteine carboxyl methyltransferase (ICMT) family protein YpbQ
MMLSEIFVERFAALAQSVKMHVGTKALRKTGTVRFAQRTNTCLATLVANFTTFVATPMIQSQTVNAFSALISHFSNRFVFRPSCF